MDCMTISTFRSLEQQAIRQFSEYKVREAAYKGVNVLPEVPTQDIAVLENVNSINIQQQTNKGLDYYA